MRYVMTCQGLGLIPLRNVTIIHETYQGLGLNPMGDVTVVHVTCHGLGLVSDVVQAGALCVTYVNETCYILNDVATLGLP